MKKKISILLAVMMIFSLLPMGVYAATPNTSNVILNSGGVVEKNRVFSGTTVPTLRLRTSENDYIEKDNDDNPFIGGTTFELRLTNADWALDTVNSDGQYNPNYDADTDSVNIFGSWNGSTATITDEPVARLELTGSIATITMLKTAVSSTVDAESEEYAITDRFNEIRIPLYTKVTSSSGDVTVRIIQNDANVTTGEYTFAIGGKAGSTIYIEDDPTEYKADDIFEVPTITIEETARTGIDAGGLITIAAPTNYEFVASDDLSVKGSSNFKPVVVVEDGITVTKDTITIRLIDDLYRNATGSGRIQISGILVSTPDDAKSGNTCTITVSGAGTTRTRLVVGTFVDYGLTFEIDEDETVTTLLSGRYLIDAATPEGDIDIEEHETARVVLKEDVIGSLWWENRKVTFKVPTGVKIIAAVVDMDNVDGNDAETTIWNGKNASMGDGTVSVEDTAVTVNRIKGDNSGTVEVYLKLYVSVDAKFSGDITLTTNALDGDEASVVIAKAIYPISIEQESTNVYLGVRQTKVGDIVIKESVPGAFLKVGSPFEQKTDALENGLYVEIEQFGFDAGRVPAVEVTDGDLIIDTDNIDVQGDGLLFIPIKTESEDYASTITISDVYLGDLFRTYPEGGYYVAVLGDSIINNYRNSRTSGYSDFIKDTTFSTESYKSTDYIIVGTPAPDRVTGGFTDRVEFAIGERTYSVNNEERNDLDVAPFIENQRTYVPVRFVAQAFGIIEEKVLWNQEKKEVYIDAGARIIQLTVGSNTIITNGTPQNMDVPAILRNQRTFVPIAHIARALNVKVGWDGENQRVIFNPTPDEEATLVMQ